MKFARRFTKSGIHIQNQIEWKIEDSKILDKDGNIIFEMKKVEVPSHWSQTATNILAQKYFRKAGVPQGNLDGIETPDMPSWLWPREDDEGLSTYCETSAKQVFHRLAGCWTYWGWKEGIFRLFSGDDFDKTIPKMEEENAQIFYDELYYMLAMQIAAPNSPQWFNTGLHWAYGISGPESGQWTIHPDLGKVTKGCLTSDWIYQTTNSYERPQPHACFIQPVNDDLVNPGGIMDLWTREVRLFKHGSGTGTNFSSIRGKGEKLSGGGVSSGLMSFLKIGDVAAGAVQSGGTTRRAAKMVCLDLDHPEIEEFITWKVKEERKARALVEGSKILNDGGEIYKDDFEGVAISSVSGQNSNNSVRVTDKFLDLLDTQIATDGGGTKDALWNLKSRTTGQIVKIVPAQDLWWKICTSAHQCADPGLQFHDTINSWHTCKNDGKINASNPCSEYMFLDNTACNLASLNLIKFHSPNTREFDTESFKHAVRLWTTVLEISVYMASFPSREIALGSYNYRTLGLGYANLGGLLFKKELKYDSDDGRNYAAAITALMHGVAYSTSGEMAQELGPFPRWESNKDSMNGVISRHLKKALQLPQLGVLSSTAENIWANIKIYSDSGFRNAQVTLIAPTGTIALLMDCETTGIEPFFAQKILKNLAGGGTMNFENKEVPVSECAIGDGCLSPLAHIKMVAAVQPFLSGAVSKTVNMPHESTVEDVNFIYREAHRLGLKAVAIYRDGSKMTQPLETRNESKNETGDITFVWDHLVRYPLNIPDPFTRDSTTGPTVDQTSSPDLRESSLEELSTTLRFRDDTKRNPLPMRRGGYTQKLRVDNHSIYLRTGEYPDGSLGEIFVNLSREGSTVRSLMECFAKAISIGMQYGVPLKEFVEAFIHTKFEPSGIVQGHDRIKMCSSIIDLIFRELAVNYLKRDDLANNNPTEERVHQTQEPLGKPFEDVLYQNLEQLYIKSEFKPNGQRDVCWTCGQMTLIRTGTCLTCTLCGANSGCG